MKEPAAEHRLHPVLAWAVPLAIAGGAGAAVLALVTITRGAAWLVPMALSLLLGMAPLGYRMLIGRMGLLRVLDRAPARRYRLAQGTVERKLPQEASLAEWRASHVSVKSRRDLGRLGEWQAIGPGPLGAIPTIIRLRYPMAPFHACLPAAMVRRGERCLAVAWSGPDAAVVAELPSEAWGWSMTWGTAAWEAAIATATEADAARSADLRALGEADVIPEEVAERALAPAGYHRVGVVPLASIADFLTLAELEFAWPADGSFAIQVFRGGVTEEGVGLEGIHAEGSRRVADGVVAMDLVAVRIGEQSLVAYLRRDLERSQENGGT
jgi:hypothetical protein